MLQFHSCSKALVLSFALFISSGVLADGGAPFPVCRKETTNGIEWKDVAPDLQKALVDCDRRMHKKFTETFQQILKEEWKLSELKVTRPETCSQMVVLPTVPGWQTYQFVRSQLLQATNASSTAELGMVTSTYWEPKEDRSPIQIGEVRDGLGNILVQGHPGIKILRSLDERIYFDVQNSSSHVKLFDTGRLLLLVDQRIGTSNKIENPDLVLHCHIDLPPVIVSNP